MKKLEAITKPYKLDAIKEVLVELGIDGMTVSEVRGLRRGGFIKNPTDFQEDYLPRIKLEIVIPDDRVEEIIAAIQRVAGCAAEDNGEILVEPVDQSIRIRTGESLDSRVV
jgi:nitrogen regulatory protein P-II 1